MTSGHHRNAAASVHQRLLNLARETNRPFEELLQLYGLERFLYRLSVSHHVDRFALKGGLRMLAWRTPIRRPTKDIDLLGHMANAVEAVVAALRDVCLQPVEEDGLHFDPETIKTTAISADAAYTGVRATLAGKLERARIRIQVDIGFGDVVVPAEEIFEFPTLLDLPAPRLRGYSKESMIAEKVNAVVQWGDSFSRVRDFFDIWALSQQFEFDGATLVEAIGKTFANRGTPASAASADRIRVFLEDPQRQVQWRAFLTKSQVDGAPDDFAGVAQAIDAFLRPVLDALGLAATFRCTWRPTKGWS